MKNRIASLFLAFVMMVSLLPNAVARDNKITVQSGGAERFTDVPTSHWAYGYINKVVGSGLFNGRTATEFEPSSAMTRSQFVMVLARMEGRSDLEGQVTQTVFPDVTATRRAAGPIAWATEQGIVQGFGDGSFKPDSPMTRGQFAALIHRYIVTKGYTNLNVLSPEPDQFTDAASVSSAFTADVEYARTHGLLTGYSDGTVRASNPVTRAAIAAILARFLDLVGESIDPDSKTGEHYVPFLDYPRPDSGDSGDTGTTPAEDAYADIKLKVSGESHGEAPYCTATRNGAAVAYDDLQPGDVVTVHFKPDSGYDASVTIKDAKGNRITPKRTTGDDNSVWFTMPAAENMPVTVTVTYSRISSGGGGGGGGGSSTYRYYLNLTAALDLNGYNENEVTPMFFAANYPPPDSYNAETWPEDSTYPLMFSSKSSTTPPPMTGYVWFTLDDDYKIDSEYYTLTPNGAETDGLRTKEVIFEPETGLTDTVYYYEVNTTELGKRGTIDGAPEVTLTARVVKKDDTPPPAGDKTWTVNVSTASGDHVYTKLSKTFDEASATDTAPLTQEDAAQTVDTKPSKADSVVYLYVTPEKNENTEYYLMFEDVTADDAANVTRVYPEGGAAVNAGELAVYKITIPEGKNTVDWITTLSVKAREKGNPIDLPRYNVNVIVKVDEGDEVDYLNLPEDKQGVAPYSYSITVGPKNGEKALAANEQGVFDNDSKSISVTAYTGSDFGEYRLTDIQLFNAYAMNEELGQKASNTLTPDEKGFVAQSFDISEVGAQDLTVLLTYKALPADETLYYPVMVDFKDDAQGEITLTIGEDKYAVKQNFDSDNENTLPEPPITMTYTEYREAYNPDLTVDDTIYEDEEGNLQNLDKWSLPISFPVSEDGSPKPPLGRNGYKFVEGTDTVRIGAATLEEAELLPVLGEANNTPLNATVVTVTMSQTYTLGYDLTIIGKGSVDVDWGISDVKNDSYSNAEEAASFNKRVSLVGVGEATLKLNVTATEGAYAAAAWDVTYAYDKAALNDEGEVVRTKATGASPTANFNIPINIPTGQKKSVSNIVVEFHEAQRDVARFTVTVGEGGGVEVKPESGLLLMDALDMTPDKAAEKLEIKGSDCTDSDAFGEGTRSYWAYAGTMITIIPTPDEGNKVYSVSVGDNQDLMQTPGFSFKLSTNEDKAEVVFAETGDVSFLAQAPFEGAGAGALKSQVKLESGKNIQDLLYALNDGEEFKTTAGNLDKVFDRYFNGDSNKNPAEFESTMRYQFRDMLQDAVSEQITSNIDDIIDAQKNAVFNADASGQSKVEQSISAGLATAFDSVKDFEPFTITDPNSIGKVIQELSGKAEYANALKGATVDNVSVSVKVTPLLKATAETNGKDLQTVITSALVGYLKNATVTKVGNGASVDLYLDVYGYNSNGTADNTVEDSLPLQLIISAEATLEKTPELNFTFTKQDAEDLMSKVTVYATVETTVTVNGEKLKTNTSTDSIDNLGLETDDIGSITDEIIAKLIDKDQGIQAKAKETWNTELNKLMDGGKMSVKMSDALDPTLLNGVIEDMLKGNDEDGEEDEESFANKMFGKVESLGDAVNTRIAFENLYSKFVYSEKTNEGFRMSVLARNSDPRIIGYTDVITDETGTEKDVLIVDLAFADYGFIEGRGAFPGLFEDVSSSDNTPYEKLVDLILALRAGIEQDIAENNDNETAASVVATLIAKQINKGTGILKATKWGQEYRSKNPTGNERKMSAATVKELSKLVADLMMADTKADQTNEWKKFEDCGYQSVSFSIGLNKGKAGDFGEAINGALELNLTSIDTGFSVTQGFGKVLPIDND